MSGSIRFRLIGLPPSTNNLYTIVAGRQVLSRAGRSYHEAVAALAAELAPNGPVSGPIALRISYRLGSRDRDVDGSHKALIDGLSGVCFNDDRQVVLLSLNKTRAALDELPSVEVIIRPLTALPADRTLRAHHDGFRLTTTLLPPSTNNSYAIAGRVRRKTREAKMVETAYRGAFTRLAAGTAPLEGPVRVRIHYGFNADRRDVDGSHKLLLDAARGLLWVDDRQISSLTLSKARSSGAPRLELAGEGGPSVR
jgi:Holliday junction resolvase RusA-like endonuclease